MMVCRSPSGKSCWRSTSAVWRRSRSVVDFEIRTRTRLGARPGSRPRDGAPAADPLAADPLTVWLRSAVERQGHRAPRLVERSADAPRPGTSSDRSRRETNLRVPGPGTSSRRRAGRRGGDRHRVARRVRRGGSRRRHPAIRRTAPALPRAPRLPPAPPLTVQPGASSPRPAALMLIARFHGVRAPQRGTRTADHLDPVDVLDRHVPQVPEHSGEQGRVDAAPVDHHEQLVGLARVEAAHPDLPGGGVGARDLHTRAPCAAPRRR